MESVLHILTPNEGSVRDVEATRELYHFHKQRHIERLSNSSYDPSADKYYQFVPQYIATLKPDLEFQLTQDPCFKDATVTAKTREDTNDIEVSFKLEGHHGGAFCTVAYIIATDSEYHVKEYWLSGEKKVSFKTPKTDAETWDLMERGPRLFMFETGLSKVVENVAATALLFEPVATRAVSEIAAKANLEFLRHHVGIDMAPLEDPSTKYFEKEIKSGDTFDILRLDGLDPMIAMAMGSATGHTAIALWKDDELFVCEANVKGSYWPVNGVQCNKYLDWMKYGELAGYNAVLSPIDRSIEFDVDKAWEFVEKYRGIDYGFEVLLTGWLDSNEGNRVCMNKEKTWCLEPAYHIEFLFSVVDRVSQDAVRIMKPALMNRAGLHNFTQNIPLVDVYHRYLYDFKLLFFPQKNKHIFLIELFWIWELSRRIFITWSNWIRTNI